jgi:hypothetical protein
MIRTSHLKTQGVLSERPSWREPDREPHTLFVRLLRAHFFFDLDPPNSLGAHERRFASSFSDILRFLAYRPFLLHG